MPRTVINTLTTAVPSDLPWPANPLPPAIIRWDDANPVDLEREVWPVLDELVVSYIEARRRIAANRALTLLEPAHA